MFQCKPVKCEMAFRLSLQMFRVAVSSIRYCFFTRFTGLERHSLTPLPEKELSCLSGARCEVENSKKEGFGHQEKDFYAVQESGAVKQKRNKTTGAKTKKVKSGEQGQELHIMQRNHSRKKKLEEVSSREPPARTLMAAAQKTTSKARPWCKGCCTHSQGKAAETASGSARFLSASTCLCL